ncbi:MAG: heparan-alpha-glucosaminide N-acetyltransferase domain-containing protein [Pirellula sp.]
MANSKTLPPRIGSLDQFRGYSVVAMFVVNFLGWLAITHHFLKHNNTHFSYADSIMPSFIFICGFTYRMSWLKRTKADLPISETYRKFLFRSIGLILLSLMFFGFSSKIETWSTLSAAKAIRFVAELIKANMWEVLAIIGALQILIMPLMNRTAWIRVLALLLFGIIHFLLCWSFNYEFVYGRANWMDDLWGTTGKRAWDGGCFGLLAWGQIMLAGTIAFDISNSALTEPAGPRVAATRFLLLGTVAMLLGYCVSCLTRFYDLESVSKDEKSHVSSPVIPDLHLATGRSWSQLMAEPPFVQPPPPTERAINYWMMDKRVVTQSFVWFSMGFALALYGLFVVACDIAGVRIGLFEMFGRNPLAAYIINHLVNHTIFSIVPKDSPLVWSLCGLSMALGVTCWFVKFLDDRKLYLRL